MTDDITKEQMNRILFANLVMMLSSSAMQQLGKLVNPVTGKTEINLEGAQVTIDMLDMLHEKTKGNLDKEESKMLVDILSSLQMNFVATSETAGSAGVKQEPGEPAAAADTPENQAGGKPGAAHKEPKYRKAY